MLTQHLHAGNIRRIARGVVASVPKHADAGNWSVDRFLAGSRLRRGGVIAYHSALELHGCAYTEGHEVQVIARGEPGAFEAVGLTCQFVKPPRGFVPPDGVTVVDRLGLEVSVTTIERTIADLFDRYDLAGGAEEFSSTPWTWWHGLTLRRWSGTRDSAMRRPLARSALGWSANRSD